MIRVSVMANDSLVVDAIASIFTEEIRLDVLQLTYGLSHKANEYIRDHRSVMITIDDGESEADSLEAPYSFQTEGPLLLMKTSLRAINLHIDRGYELTDPPMEQVTQIVKDFSRTYLRGIHQEVATCAM
jgi:hypothetical protein